MQTLAELLKDRGISAREVQRRGGPARMSLHRWQRGLVVPRADAVRALARALGVSVRVAADAVAASVERARRDAARVAP